MMHATDRLRNTARSLPLLITACAMAVPAAAAENGTAPPAAAVAPATATSGVSAANSGNSAATDRATFFSNAQFQTIWQDLEKRQVINQRVVEGGRYSINVRIVKPTDAPLVHGKSADVWVVTAGTATAVTGGTLRDPKQRANADDIAGSAIVGGKDQPVAAGDIVFVPPGVPHGFKDLNGFRAFLIRFDTK